MNNIGLLYKTTIFGASHEEYCGVLIEGVKPGLSLKEEDFWPSLDRRRPGNYGTPRKESDKPLLMSGLYNGYTTGMPLLIMFKNENKKSSDYANLINQPRPSHADFVANQKYKGFNDPRGGGSFSGRLTLGIVASGVVASKIFKVNMQSEIISLKGITDKTKFKEILETAKNNKDSVGGIIQIKISDLPIGLGEPYFASLESELARALYSIGSVKGVSFGSGFAGTSLFGSDFNDLIIDKTGKTKTNHNGGINGGISNGMPVRFHTVIKPTPSIAKKQNTVNYRTKEEKVLEIHGRHDPAIIHRARVVVDAVTALVIADSLMERYGREYFGGKRR